MAQVNLQFGDFELDLDRENLTRNGQIVDLQNKPLRLLIALVSAPGELVTRERLRAELWSDGFHVDFEHGLNTAMRRLRETLGDTAGAPRFIETIPRHGYRFIAPVTSVANPRPGRTAVIVLPFVNLTSDPEGLYLSDGIMEDLLTELSRIRALKVLSRTSSMRFRNSSRTVSEIARELHVDVAIEGSVRREGRRVRIAARVIDGRKDEQLWANVFERDVTDLFAIQRSIAQQIASALAPQLSAADRALLGRPATTDHDAYEAYLHGRHLLHRFTDDGFRHAIEYFERAAACDPDYARPHAGIAFAFMVLGMGHGAGRIPQQEAYARARSAIHRALAIDPTLAEAHGVDACLKFMFEFDWPGAEEAFRTALSHGPDSAEILDTFGLFLSSSGRYDEALAAQRKAHELDPLAPVVMSDIATTLLRAGLNQEALEQAGKLVLLEPEFPMAHSTLGWAHIRQGWHREGLREIEKAVQLSPGNTLFLGQLGAAYALTGNETEAKKILERMESMREDRYVSPYHLSYIYAALGDPEGACSCLERAIDDRAGGVYGAGGSFLFESLRDHPRFIDLMQKMNCASVPTETSAPASATCPLDLSPDYGD